jgi:hypothetical protein
VDSIMYRKLHSTCKVSVLTLSDQFFFYRLTRLFECP